MGCWDPTSKAPKLQSFWPLIRTGPEVYRRRLLVGHPLLQATYCERHGRAHHSGIRNSPVAYHHRASSRKNVPTNNTTHVTRRMIHGLILSQRVRTQITIRSFSPLSANASTNTSGMWLTNVHVEWAATDQYSRTDYERECRAERDGAEDAETSESHEGAKACPSAQGSDGDECPRDVEAGQPKGESGEQEFDHPAMVPSL